MVTKTHPCPQCGKEVDDFNGRNKPKKYCSRTCKSEASHDRYYATHPEHRKKVAMKAKERKSKLKKLGLCAECGEPAFGKFRCYDCNQMDMFRTIARSPE
jgi:hypothetical protein